MLVIKFNQLEANKNNKNGEWASSRSYDSICIPNSVCGVARANGLKSMIAIILKRLSFGLKSIKIHICRSPFYRVPIFIAHIITKSSCQLSRFQALYPLAAKITNDFVAAAAAATATFFAHFSRTSVSVKNWLQCRKSFWIHKSFDTHTLYRSWVIHTTKKLWTD